MNKIEKFEDEYFFLSNFYPCYVEWEGFIFSSSENAYQASKVPIHLRDEKWRTHTTITAAASKKLGRRLPLRDDWNQVKDGIMDGILTAKFDQHPDLKKKLLATYLSELIEGNWWGDVYWGVCKGVGKNKLGIALMILRERYHFENLVGTETVEKLKELS